MTEEVLTGDAAASEEANLRSTIRAAVETQRAAQTEPAEASPLPEGDAPADRDSDRARDEKGRFAAKAQDGDPAKTETEAAAPEHQNPEADPDPEQSKSASDIRPPPGFSVASKEAWDQLPDSVKTDIAKRETEMNAGMQRYSGLGRYASEAERNGTTLQKAVDDYYAVEQSLRGDFIGGVEAICQRFGVDPRALSTAMQARYGGAAPQQADHGQQSTQAPQPQAIDRNAIIEAARAAARAEHEAARAADLEEQERRDTQTQISAFSSDPKNRFFENVRDDMATLMSAGKAQTLKEAYDAACWLNPETRTILIREQATSANPAKAAAAVNQAKAAAKAVGGAPAPGFKPAAPGHDPNLSLRDTIKAAMSAQRGAV
jgi:hypothetical protein